MSGLHVSTWILDSIENIASEFPSFGRFKFWETEADSEISSRPFGQALHSYPEEALVLRDIWQAFTVKLGAQTEFEVFDAHGRIRYAPFSTKYQFAKLEEHRISFALITLFLGLEYHKVATEGSEDDLLDREFSKRRDLLKGWFLENKDLVYNGRRLDEWIRLYSATEAYKHAHKTEGGFRKRLIKKLWDRSTVLEDISNFVNEVVEEAVCARLRLAVSRKAVMTLVPRQTKVGDVVCLLRGAECPIILRPRGHAYLFIDAAERYPYCYDQHRMNLTALYDRDWERLHII